MTMRTDLGVFGAELRRWRNHRRFSQLEMATRAAVSQRHLSFLETGRSRPSPEMVEHLSVVLDIPLRARNGLLNAAGFAPAYTQKPLDGAALAHVRKSLETLVTAHDPFPAYVVDRSWNLLIANNAAALLTGALLSSDAALELGGNVLRLFLHPEGARHSVVNWQQAGAVLVSRLQAECEAFPGDVELNALMDEILAYDGVGDLSPTEGYGSNSQFLTEIQVRSEGSDLRFYTTISTLAAPSDITLEELRLETLLPADEVTSEALRGLRASGQ